MLYQKEYTSIFHVHIPRTAGRYIRNIFLDNKFDGKYLSYDEFYRGIEVPHLHYPLYNDLSYVENSNHFAVVRDPFERFKSSMQLMIRAMNYPVELYDKLKDKDWLFNFLNHSRDYKQYHQNHFRKQSDFISARTHVYKFEDGLGIELIDWLNDRLNLDLNRTEYRYEIFHPHSISGEELPNKKDIDPIVENCIRDYYSDDYENLKY